MGLVSAGPGSESPDLTGSRQEEPRPVWEVGKDRWQPRSGGGEGKPERRPEVLQPCGVLLFMWWLEGQLRVGMEITLRPWVQPYLMAQEEVSNTGRPVSRPAGGCWLASRQLTCLSRYSIL